MYICDNCGHEFTRPRYQDYSREDDRQTTHCPVCGSEYYSESEGEEGRMNLKIMLDGNEHTARLLEERGNGRQKIYLLDFKIYKDVKGKEINSLYDDFEKNLKKEYVLNDTTEYVDKICVSDAFTHAERLVFSCFYVKNIENKERRIVVDYYDIAGETTAMIFGGDTSTMLPPEEYIRQLWEVNREYNQGASHENGRDE